MVDTSPAAARFWRRINDLVPKFGHYRPAILLPCPSVRPDRPGGGHSGSPTRATGGPGRFPGLIGRPGRIEGIGGGPSPISPPSRPHPVDWPRPRGHRRGAWAVGSAAPERSGRPRQSRRSGNSSGSRVLRPQHREQSARCNDLDGRAGRCLINLARRAASPPTSAGVTSSRPATTPFHGPTTSSGVGRCPTMTPRPRGCRPMARDARCFVGRRSISTAQPTGHQR